MITTKCEQCGRNTLNGRYCGDSCSGHAAVASMPKPVNVGGKLVNCSKCKHPSLFVYARGGSDALFCVHCKNKMGRQF